MRIGLPSVSVPVLSIKTISRFFAVSKVSAFRIKIPLDVATLLPTRIAVGVARPNAQGHAIIKTAIP